jgi:RNA-directed DNA polymerase
VNTGASWPTPSEAEARVLEIQTKLHRWATDDSARRFDDLYNLVCDPAFLLVGWRRVRGNRGARSAGVDGESAHYVTAVRGERVFLSELRAELKARSFHPLPVRERMIPKRGGKQRRLGIATVRDRVVQAALKLVLEPILEADFKPCSYGFRPRRRAQDAIAEIHFFCSRSYEWVIEGDVENCFDQISHSALVGRLRARIADRRVLALVKRSSRPASSPRTASSGTRSPARPKAGSSRRCSVTSPSPSSTSTSSRPGRRWATPTPANSAGARGWPTTGSSADDFVVLVAGDRAHAESLRGEAAAVLRPIGLCLSETKTTITHIDEGFDFLGFRIRRRQKRGAAKRHVYTYPSACRRGGRQGEGAGADPSGDEPVARHPPAPAQPGAARLEQLFRHGDSSKTFAYLGAFSWRRVWRSLCNKHPRRPRKELVRRYYQNWRPVEDEVTLYNPAAVAITRYRYRGADISSPRTAKTAEPDG